MSGEEKPKKQRTPAQIEATKKMRATMLAKKNATGATTVVEKKAKPAATTTVTSTSPAASSDNDKEDKGWLL